jgi:hypothetical protein
MSLTRNVSRHLNAVGQANAGDFAKGRVRLFGSSSFNLSTDTSFLRISLATPGGTTGKSIVSEAESWCFYLLGYRLTPLPH